MLFRSIGEARGEAIGEARGREAGIREANLKIAQNLKAAGMSLEQIYAITGVSPQELETAVAIFTKSSDSHG